MNLKPLSVTITMSLLGLSQAGTFVALAPVAGIENYTLTGDNTKTTIGRNFNYGTVVPVAHAFITSSVTSSSAVPGFGGTSFKYEGTYTATFRLSWKQDYVGEATPSTVYHHHTYTRDLRVEYTGPALAISGKVKVGTFEAATTNSGNPGSGAAYSAGTTWGTQSITTPALAWTESGTDSSGRKTYYADIPVATPALSSEGQIFRTNVTGTALLSNVLSLSDNFYFSLSSTPSNP